MPRALTSVASASGCIGWPARRPGTSQRELRFVAAFVLSLFVDPVEQEISDRSGDWRGWFAEP